VNPEKTPDLHKRIPHTTCRRRVDNTHIDAPVRSTGRRSQRDTMHDKYGGAATLQGWSSRSGLAPSSSAARNRSNRARARSRCSISCTMRNFLSTTPTSSNPTHNQHGVCVDETVQVLISRDGRSSVCSHYEVVAESTGCFRS
jgi:hypothetical protein